jgi:GT2 family glycosyltransferase
MERTTPKFLIAIPFYKNIEHITYVKKSISHNFEFLKKSETSILLLNDSPNYEELKDAIMSIKNEFDLPIEYFENRENLGFIKTINIAIGISIKEKKDLLILNSDTIVFPNAIQEIQAVAYSDPMIGFVCPRSNNATLASLPHKFVDQDISPEIVFSVYSKINKIIPRISYVPTAVGFCLFLKYIILSDFGGLDEIYGMGYCEENDLIMRANRCGFRAVLANHAFVWHKGSDSFAKLDKNFIDFKNSNAKILEKRYPEYEVLINNYFGGENFKAESLIAQLIPNENNKLEIGFDFSIFGPFHNGTFELGKKILNAAVTYWSESFEIIVFINDDALLFHDLKKYKNVKFLTPDNHTKCAAIIRTNQIFTEEDVVKLYNQAPIVYVFMLDTIAVDCGNLNVEFNKSLWTFISKWTDIIFTISEYSSFQFNTRFIVSPPVKVVPLLPSVDIREYKSSLEPVTKKNYDRKKLFIVGNKFEHKAVIPTVNKLANIFPEMDFTVLVGRSVFSDFSNVEYIQNNTMTDSEISNLYAHSDAIIFPSYYEGFGFPVLHGLSKNTPIYLRKIKSSLEIVSQIKNAKENTYFFETLDDLVLLLKLGIPAWQGGEAVGENDGWKRVALNLEEHLFNSLKELNYNFLVDRLQWVNESFANQVAKMSHVKNLNNIVNELLEKNKRLENKTNRIKIIEILQSIIGRKAILVFLKMIPQYLK